MNATRAATIRGRAWVGGVVSLGRVQTPTLAIIVRREREIQAFVPEPYWLVHGSFDPRYDGLWFDPSRLTTTRRLVRRPGSRRRRAEEIVAKVVGQDRHRRVGRAQGAVRERAAALRPHLAPARRELAASASPRAARSRPRSPSTRTRRRSPIRAPTRATSRATSSRSSSRRPRRSSRSPSTRRRPGSS